MSEVLPPPFGREPLTAQRVVVKDSTVELPEYPDTYTTGAEDLAREEIRLTALGYPARRGQGCAGFLEELGNGEVFIFDAGAGTNSAFNHMRVLVLGTVGLERHAGRSHDKAGRRRLGFVHDR